MKKLATTFGILGLGILAALVFPACDRTTSPVSPNLPPNTTLANIPVDGDTLFALVTLHWDGEDNDGFIARYQYRYVTYHVFKGDSVVQEWQETTATSVEIAFESSDSLNFQRFEVRAVDNQGDADLTPAVKHFYTVQTIFPETELLSPQDGSQAFAIGQVTDWWLGVKLDMTAHDRDGEVVEYAWSVDNQQWNWTVDTSLYITPDFFAPPLSGEHLIRVTCRDNTNLIDPAGDSVTVRLIQPRFSQQLLIIDETDESNFTAGINANDAQVDNFYHTIFGVNSSWDYKSRGMPPRDTLGLYQLIVWHSDDRPVSQPAALPAEIEIVQDYMNVGGDFIMSGWRILKSFAWDDNFPVGFSAGSFVHDYLHITMANETGLVGDFNAAVGDAGFSTVRVDSLKLLEAFPFFGRLGQINYVPFPDGLGGFTKPIYRYSNDPGGILTEPRGQPCGLRYYGTSFDAVILGFPIFFIRQDDAQVLAAELLQSLGYPAPAGSNAHNDRVRLTE